MADQRRMNSGRKEEGFEFSPKNGREKNWYRYKGNERLSRNASEAVL